MTDNPFRNYDEAAAKLGITVGPTMSVTVAPSPPGSSIDETPTMTVCKICDTGLNEFQSAYGERQWVHSRAWVKYDHDPVAVKVPREKSRYVQCDFCGIVDQLVWSFKGDRVQQTTGNTTTDHGDRWAACKDCAPLIWARDTEAVINRVMRLGPVASKTPKRHQPLMRDELAKMIVPFIASITAREYIGLPVTPVPLNPRLMVKLHTGLIRYWLNPKLPARLIKPDRPGHPPFLYSVPGFCIGEEETFRASYTNGDRPPPEALHHHVQHIVNGIEEAGVDGNLYWISSDFTTLAIAAGQELTDFHLSHEELPADHGMIVWADPIGEIERPWGVAGVRCMTWTLVPGGIQINSYIQFDDADPTVDDVVAVREENGYFMSTNFGSGIPFEGWNDHEITQEERHRGNFILTLLATMFLINQPGVAQVDTGPIDRKLQRSYRRAGRQLPEVKLVDLRRHEHAAVETAEQAAERRKISVRFMVRGHWKRQAYGPARSLRRQIYIAPFMKGPDGAPLKVPTPVVKVLR